jgi:anti-sigma-K factor RskA
VLQEAGSGLVVAVIENRAKEVGVAAYDPANNRLHLTQASSLPPPF